MKKVQTNKTKKLTLGKMTVAKLQLSEQQMRYFMGGDDIWLGKTSVEIDAETNCTRTGTIKPTVGSNQ